MTLPRTFATMSLALAASVAGACPWHGPLGHGAGVVGSYTPGVMKEAPGAGGETMFVQVSDHLDAARNATHKTSEGAVSLGSLHGYHCAVARVAGEDGPAVPQYELSCSGKDGEVERVRHRCDPNDPGLAPEAYWAGLNPMGMTVVTVTLACR